MTLTVALAWSVGWLSPIRQGVVGTTLANHNAERRLTMSNETTKLLVDDLARHKATIEAQAAEIKRLERDNATWQNQDLLEQCNRQADRIEELEAEIERLRHDHEESCNEQKLSENWRTAWMNRTFELEYEQEKMIEVLHRCTLHLEQEAEAELVEDRWQANDAMILCNDIDGLFAAYPLPAALHPDAYKKEASDE
jgi:hypothetical protein